MLAARTRIAPTPSGFLHLGNAASFVLTALAARLSRRELALRIDDFDQARCRTEYVDDVFCCLDWMGIEWGYGPGGVEEFFTRWSQSLRRERYRQVLAHLIELNVVFPCRCTRQEILARTRSSQFPIAQASVAYDGHCQNLGVADFQPGMTWRARFRPHEHDELPCWAEATVKIPHLISLVSMMYQDFYPVVWRRDDIPAYHLVSVVDDIDWNVDVIVRGEDLLQSSVFHLWLSEQCFARSCEQSSSQASRDHLRVYHHPLLQKDSQKLSKSQLQQSDSLKSQYGKPELVMQMAVEILKSDSTPLPRSSSHSFGPKKSRGISRFEDLLDWSAEYFDQDIFSLLKAASRSQSIQSLSNGTQNPLRWVGHLQDPRTRYLMRLYKE